jgi:hypothetical protein
MWHPRTISDLARELRAQHKQTAFDQFVEEKGNDGQYRDRGVPDGEPRPGCPKCGGWVLAERKRTGRGADMLRYRCQTQRNRRYCHHEFEEAVIVQPIAVDDGAFRMKQEFNAAYHAIYEGTSELILRTAAIQAVEDFADYMEGVDTYTFCRRCAYMWDVKGLRLCTSCHDAWHPHMMQKCKGCETGKAWIVCKVCAKARHLESYPTCAACA